jgi:aspartyl/asparaginyl-tRNA synthetase/glutamate mutase epsilon subunit
MERAPRGSFGAHVLAEQAAGRLVVQPRMGMDSPAEMRAGLAAVKAAAPGTVGTVTLDAFTRTGDEAAVREALASGGGLNGYPLTVHPVAVTRSMLEGIRSPEFPVQVRHGSPAPQAIFRALVAAGLDATEGGPVSYCLPYSRMPVRESVRNWTECCRILAAVREDGVEPHLETFGGCMLGQLCPPGLLIAISVLEALFFRAHGLRSISLSYAQQTSPGQDREAIGALNRLAAELLPDVEWHVVLYAYMGVYPRTEGGARDLLKAAAELAVEAGAARLIVKTTAEAHRIPTVGENLDALRTAARAAGAHRAGLVAGLERPPTRDTGLYAEARGLIEAVLELDPDPGLALAAAIEGGVLDVPFCLHPDNAGRARSHLDRDGALRWTAVGRMPLDRSRLSCGESRMTSGLLLGALSAVAERFDRAALERETSSAVPGESGRVPIPSAKTGEPGAMTTATPVSTRQRTPASLPPDDPREHLTSPRTRNALTVQQHLLTAAREHLRAHGFIELLPPIIGPVTDPGVRGSKQVDVDYYGHRYKLMSSAILYKQASLLSFEKFFYIAPNVRLEPLETSSTSRHLAEFHQIDVEVAGADRQAITEVLEGLVTSMIRTVLERARPQLAELGRDTAPLYAAVSEPFESWEHEKVVARLLDLGHEQSPDAEIDWQAEAIFSRALTGGAFVTNYPKGSRGFYDREDPDRAGLLRNFDLLMPEGYGELCSGSERENDYARLVTRMRETGENPAKYDWYLRLAKEGIPASAGFGIGLERLTRYVCGLDAVWQASAFPKLPGRVSP